MDMQFGDFRIRLHERELVGPTGPVELSGRSFDLLCALLGQPDRLLDKAALFDAVWPGVVVEENTLQVHMSALRKALGPGFIATVHGRGYKYVGPPPRQRDESPATRTNGLRGNIELYRADCVARDTEAAALARLIAQQRLVSIVGPGGVGKTTLAVAVNGGLIAEGGVWMIDLAALNSGEFVESAVIQTLAISFRAGSRALDSIIDFLRSSDAVLVFDNCEHVRSAAAGLIRTVLAEAPGVRILATTQIPLGLPEEHVFKLLPFAVNPVGDEAGELASAQFLAHCYETFGEKLSPEELPIVERLCRRLDGVALALKMAAARAATVGLETVDRQLEQRLAGLAADWDPALARHRSLAASLDWSYDLLNPDHQHILRLLGVFHGSFSLAAVEAVAGAGAEARLAELVRRSLVVRDSADRNRYRLLDSTRQFALNKLGEADIEARNRHAAYVAALFVDSITRWETLPDVKWDQTYRPDGDNLRAALAWTRARADWPLYGELAAASCRYFIEEQLGAEGLETIEAGMSELAALPPETAARLQLALAEICRFNAMDIRAHQGLVPAVTHFRTSSDLIRRAQALVLLSWTSIFFRSPGEAASAVGELESIIGQLPLSKVKSWSLVASGIHMWTLGQAAAGLARAEAGLAMHLETGNPKGRFRSAINLCEMLHKGHDTERALRLGQQILPDLRLDGTTLQLGIMLTNVATYHFALGQPEAAAPLLREVAEVLPRDGSHWHWCLLQAVAELHANLGSAETAALLLGYVDINFEGWRDGRQTTEEMQRERLLALLATKLPDGERDRLMQRGHSLSQFEADHLAVFAPDDRPSLKL